jgi:hypothetical protein
VQSQPSVQLSQHSLSQLQSGQPSQQSLLQQPPVQVAAVGVVEANASAPVRSAPTAARDQSVLVNMIKLTFWLMMQFRLSSLTTQDNWIPENSHVRLESLTYTGLLTYRAGIRSTSCSGECDAESP